MLREKHASRTLPRRQIGLGRHPVRLALVLWRAEALHAIIPRPPVGLRLRAHGSILPAVVVAPAVGKSDDLARLPDGRKGLQGRDHDLPLQGRVVRLASGAPQGEIQVDGAGRIDGLGDRVGAGQADGRQAAAFQLPRNQPDGLMADGSDRHQYGEIDLVAQ